MTDDLANAGAAPAESGQPSISGDREIGASSEPNSGMRAAFEKAQAELDGDKPKRGRPPKPATQAREVELPGSDKVRRSNDTRQADEAASEALKAPERWEAPWKEAFGKQPREVQEAWLAQHGAWEKGFNKKFEELSAQRKFAEEINAAIPQPMREVMQARGLQPAQAVARLFQQFHQSETDPANFIASFMLAKKIDPRMFMPRGQERAVHEYFAPILQPLLSKISRLEQGQTAWLEKQDAEHRTAMGELITSFHGEVDDSGASKFPYVEQVAHTMAELIENDPRFARMEPRQRLEEAYKIAVLSDPAIRDEIVAAEASRRAEALEQDRLNGRLSRAASARPSASPSPRSAQAKGMRGAFDRAVRQMGAA